MSENKILNQDGVAVESKQSEADRIKKENDRFCQIMKDLYRPAMKLMVGFGER